MTTYKFSVEEVKRDGFIAWDAIEDSTNASFPLNTDGYLVAGTFPEITDYIKRIYGTDIDVSYDAIKSDSLNGSTWTYNRGKDTVIVKDMPRAVFRITSV